MIKSIKDNNGKYFTLFKRYHNAPLPVPKMVLTIVDPFPFLISYLYKFLSNGCPVLIFVPTIKEGEVLFEKLKMNRFQGEFVHSKKINRDKIIDDFKNKKYHYLITTSILERGITIRNLQVIIYNCDNLVFDKKTIIQIAGRVGRKKDATQGEVILISKTQSQDMIDAIKDIKDANR